MNQDTNALEMVVDLDQYPVHDPAHPRYRELLEYCRAELGDDGCCSVPNFFRSSDIIKAAIMAERLSDSVHRPTEDGNAYDGVIDDSLPEDHPRRYRLRRGGGFICADLLDTDPLSSMAITSMWDEDTFPDISTPTN